MPKPLTDGERVRLAEGSDGVVIIVVLVFVCTSEQLQMDGLTVRLSGVVVPKHAFVPKCDTACQLIMAFTHCASATVIQHAAAMIVLRYIVRRLVSSSGKCLVRYRLVRDRESCTTDRIRTKFATTYSTSRSLLSSSGDRGCSWTMTHDAVLDT